MTIKKTDTKETPNESKTPEEIAVEAKKKEENLQDKNPMQILEDFNIANATAAEKKSEGSPEEGDEKTEKPKKDEVEAKTEKTEKTEKPEEDEKIWLIKDKFEDTEEGRAAMAKSYKEVQGMAQKNKTALEEQGKDMAPLMALNQLLESDPRYAKALIAVQKAGEATKLKPPERPDDYDILDEADEESSSAKWRKENDKYLVEQGKQAAVAEVKKLSDRIEGEKAAGAEIIVLKGMGLSEQDIVDFRAFMADEANDTQENLVKVWRFLTGKKVEKAITTEEEKAAKLLEEAGTKETPEAAAAKTGSEEGLLEPKDKLTEQIADNLMEIST